MANVRSFPWTSSQNRFSKQSELEVARALSSRPLQSPQPAKESETNRPVVLSKAKAAQALGVSVRTIDNFISQNRIRVLRTGRRVLVPMDSIQAALRNGSLETHPGK
jgi:excisionase family DNA binding protein